jgi:hypothetical protein
MTMEYDELMDYFEGCNEIAAMLNEEDDREGLLRLRDTVIIIAHHNEIEVDIKLTHKTAEDTYP